MIDQSLLRGIHRTVGDRLQLEQTARRARGDAGLAGENEKQKARELAVVAVRDHVQRQLEAGNAPLRPEEETTLVEAVIARMYGAGQLQALLDDEQIEDIDINGHDQVWIRFADGSKVRGAPVASSDDELIELVQTLAAYSGRSSRPFDAANPELDLRLPDGSRLSAVQGVSGRPAVSIRRHRYKRATLTDLVDNKTITTELGDFFAGMVRARMNVVIAGETGAGKTTLLRALASAISPEERIITVENSLELGLRADEEAHPDCVEFEARLSNSEGQGEVSMERLVRRTLRHRPDRIIVGEVLGPEILTMLQAMTQGNDGSLSTIHARSARETFERIATYALTSVPSIPREAAFSLVAGGIDFIVFVQRDRTNGTRRVTQVLEVNGYDPNIGGGPSANDIFAADSSGLAQWTGVMPARIERLRAAGWDPTSGGWGQ